MLLSKVPSRGGLKIKLHRGALRIRIELGQEVPSELIQSFLN